VNVYSVASEARKKLRNITIRMSLSVGKVNNLGRGLLRSLGKARATKSLGQRFLLTPTSP